MLGLREPSCLDDAIITAHSQSISSHATLANIATAWSVKSPPHTQGTAPPRGVSITRDYSVAYGYVLAEGSEGQQARKAVIDHISSSKGGKQRKLYNTKRRF